MYLFKTTAALVLALAAANAADGSTAANTNFIHRLIGEAVTKHPKVGAADARTQAAASAARGVRLWQDPQVGLGMMAANNMRRRVRGDILASIDQPLPRLSLYKAEKRKANAAELAQQATQQQTANELGLSVAQAVLELALADEVIRLQAENLAWLGTLVKTAEERSKNPNATATETLRLESEFAVRAQTLASAKRQRAQFATTLNLLLVRPPEAPWAPLMLPAHAEEIFNSIVLKVRLERDNPQLGAMRHMVEGAQAEADAARARKKPVFSVGTQYFTYSGGSINDSMLVFGFKMTLPWFNSRVYKADIERADHLRAASQQDLDAEQRELYTQLTALITEAKNQQQLAEAYTDEVLPKSEQAIKTLQNAWVSSKATLLEVLDAQRLLLDARQEQKRALAARHAASYSLSALVGGLTKTPIR
ncbi:MAG: TolC family protein [Prosthecobacter sp.]|uniref:TolC family protein n=1 Tax=Prosthecobacter sp. TaxID=1965333 RepID=UPI0026007D57|nr:TolC family protein [Prosthecobacter sp.]MCF7787718.1 TolC family protein [Prosthecobacter sp.]